MAARSRKCSGCGTGIEAAGRTGKCRKCLVGIAATSNDPIGAPALTSEQRLQQDQANKAQSNAFSDLKGKYDAALKLIEQQDAELAWISDIRAGVDNTFRIEAREGLGTSEVTPIVLLSDWHSEEIVKPAQVNGLNEFNLEIFEKRATKFWQGTLRLIRMFNQDVKITTVVLGLLGDFITGQIHGAENAENNGLTPVPAIINAQDKLIAGLDFLLNNTTYDFVLVCKVGNHSRTTIKVRSGSEMGHSLETLMYACLAAYYRNEPRMKFIIDDGYHTYLDIYSETCRFHHGHSIQYQGGVGGLYIPARKAVEQWNKGRKATRDFFGHFHQDLNDSMFTCNGSLIGYNSFAVRIKAAYEVPKQSMVLVDKRRGFTGKWPILLS